jgi:hypothetical protein
MKYRLVRFLGGVVAVSLLAAAAGPAAAQQQRRAPAAAAPNRAPALRSISVLPERVVLQGSRSEQTLIVTGEYSDGSLRDLSDAATYRVQDGKVARVELDETRQVLRPAQSGDTRLTVTVRGARAVTVPVEVRGADQAPPVSFQHEVVPALTKAGCSMGTCHGTPTGKGGFRLSLQGYAPELDYEAIAREGGARRVNAADPGRSLLLLKPMAMVSHAGGKRLYENMPEFEVLTRWIAEGVRSDPPDVPKVTRVEILPGRRLLMLPGVRQQVAAIAHFSDGTSRDVTSIATLSTTDDTVATVTREGLVEGTKRGDVAIIVRYQEHLESLRLTFLQEVPGFQWPETPEYNYIDRHVFERLKLFQIPVSGLASDREFLRRAYLDTLGLLPTPDEVRAFLADPAPDKRARLVDRLLERPEFADFWALKWADVLRIQDEKLKGQGARAYHNWVRESIAANKPMDQFVREIVTATGPTFESAPANFFRVLGSTDELGEATAQLFLGVRMSCAKCHNHPFERWTQDEYYQFAAFFAQVERKEGPQKEELTIRLKPEGEVTHLRTGEVMQPRLLGDAFVQMAKEDDRRQALAEWMTRKDNPFFARALANRIWANLIGRGIVEPIDDFRESNPSVNEGLLEALTDDLANSSFDLRHLVRVIMSSRTYQLSAQPKPLNKDDNTYFSHAVTRILSAEQLADAVSQVLGVPDRYEGYPEGTRAAQLAGTTVRTQFLKTFGRPDRNLTCECEREKEPTLFQALSLISGREVHAKVRSDTGRLAILAASDRPVEEIVEELYLSALARPPSKGEMERWKEHLSGADRRREALEDLGWVLINSKEFLFRY